jgi:hypothetical protein
MRHHRHKDILPEQPVYTVDRPYTEPPGLSEVQKKITAECEKFLDNEKLSFLRARLLGGISGWYRFTDEEARKVKAVATKHKYPLE